MNSKKTPSKVPHRDRSSNRERPLREGVEHGNHRSDNGGRKGQTTINERDPLPTKQPIRRS